MTPIELIFYNKKGEETKTHVKPLILWGDYKAAMSLTDNLKAMDTAEGMEAITDFVVTFFDGAFSRAELDKKAVPEQVLACYYGILARTDDILAEVNFRKGWTAAPKSTTTSLETGF